MGKNIFLYVNQYDLSKLLEVVYNKGASVYNNKMKEVEQIPAIAEEFPIFYIGYNGTDYIEYVPSFHTLKYLQTATIRMENNLDSKLKKLFEEIKKYIRKSYMISSDKSNYIGPGMYQEWIEKKYCFPMSLRYIEFSIAENEVAKVFDTLLKDGYKVKTNKARLRNRDLIDFTAESFVVFGETASIVTTILRKSIIIYEYDSECIFVYRRKKQKTYVFHLDQRLLDEPSSEISVLFEKIREQWSYKSE